VLLDFAAPCRFVLAQERFDLPIRRGAEGALPPGPGEAGMNLLADHNLPFVAALGFMLLLAIVQIAGGGLLDFDADADVDADVDSSLGAADGLLSLVGFGKLPLVMWLALLLFLFAGTGIGIQSLASAFLGAPFGPLLAPAIAGGVALPWP